LEKEMRVSRKVATQNRRNVISTASRLFREKGIYGVGLDGLMKEAGLTHGGFYGQFGSRDNLVLEALAHAAEAGAERNGRHTNLADFIDSYLAAKHCNEPGNGCVVAALAGEISRQSPKIRGAFTQAIKAFVERIEGLLGRSCAPDRREEAILTASAMVGALILARAVNEPGLSIEILSAARKGLHHRAARPTGTQGRPKSNGRRSRSQS
jgi:TetR/AcrR family transcriptional regulator, transcriptional repressor for nem operon